MEVLHTAYGVVSIIAKTCLWILVLRALYRWRDTQKLFTALGVAVAEVMAKHHNKP